jgi:hypothetical protein|tara:strand:+ start:4836 stop:5390 length:555 start_codon:yes stop_codon:yes gene_type:complete
MSNITTAGFDEAFPVAGQDNDSQGFRTNFNVTKVALELANTEIGALELNTAKLNADNDFNGSLIQEAEFKATTETVYASGNVTTSQNVSFANGHYQTIQVGADVTLTLADWPVSSKMGKMRMQITGDGTPRTITWAASGGGAFKTAAAWPVTFTVTSQTNPVFVDFWTINSGITVFAEYLGAFD